MNIFKKSKELELKIATFLDIIIKGATEFKQAIKFYMNNELNDFEERLDIVDKYESKGDELRRDIENQLYLYTLIPESRGDVLALLEVTDNILNLLNETLLQFSIEKPFILQDLKIKYIELTDVVINSVEELVRAIRAYFTDINSVRDYINKVYVYEKESDKIAESIKRYIFLQDIELAIKIHLRDFTFHIEHIADEAEDVADRLAVYTIKRMI